MSDFSIVLVAPEIPGNTGSIGRTCVALNIPLIIIGPCAFSLDEKAVRRAGLDYWKHLHLIQYSDWEEFISHKNPCHLFFFSRRGPTNYFSAKFVPHSYLIFGSESRGLPLFLFENYPEHFYHIPQYSPHIRSLNLANCATAVAYETHRQISFGT